MAGNCLLSQRRSRQPSPRRSVPDARRLLGSRGDSTVYGRDEIAGPSPQGAVWSDFGRSVAFGGVAQVGRSGRVSSAPHSHPTRSANPDCRHGYADVSEHGLPATGERLSELLA
jgi:hypothetical protein